MFTSRLPKSTSARRPSNPNDGLTSLIGSNIPVSVRKANLFTPQPKRSLQNGLNSTSRKSYLTTEKKYQRPSKPAPDRDEQLRMFENLVDFLKQKEPTFPVPEAKRFFSSVSTTECSRIFEFLIGRLFTDFKINKLEIDVPDALALLEYPYLRAVTKSALVSITTRQAIVNLLVIFDWLVNFSKDSDADDMLPAIEDDRSDPPILSCILSNPSEPIDEFEQKMNSHATNNEPQMEILENLIAECNRLEGQWDEIQRLEAEEQAFVNDFQECARYKAQITDYLAIRHEQEVAIDQRSLQTQEELSERRRQLEKLSPIVDLEQPACDPATLAHLIQKLERAEEDLRNEKSSVPGQSQTIELKKQELNFTETKYNEQKNKLANILASESNNLRALKSGYEKTVATNTERIQKYLETYSKEAQSNVKEIEVDDTILVDVCRKVKTNNKIVRAGAWDIKRVV